MNGRRGLPRIELSHHQRDLTSVVSGMVREMLHQVPQAQFLFANRKHFCQGRFGQAIHELGLLFLDFCPLQPNRSDVRKCVRMEKVVEPRPQIRQQSSGMRRLPPVGKPAPLAAQDMHERVSYGAKAAAQVPRELLNAQGAGRFENPIVRPAVVFEQQLNVISIHISPQRRGGNGRRNVTLPR